MNNNQLKLPGPIVRRQDTGEILNLSPQQIARAMKAYRDSPEGQKAQEQARARRYARVAEEAHAQSESFERILQGITTLDVTCLSGQFNALFAALYELNPDFLVTPETDLDGLYNAVIAARTEWFTQPQITEEEFWATLHQEGIPKQQYFTSVDQANFGKAQPDREAEGYTLRELFDWLQGKTTPKRAVLKLPKSAHQSTFIEARTVSHAVSDAQNLRDWAEIDGQNAFLHSPRIDGKKSPLETRFEPTPELWNWWA